MEGNAGCDITAMNILFNFEPKPKIIKRQQCQNVDPRRMGDGLPNRCNAVAVHDAPCKHAQ